MKKKKWLTISALGLIIIGGGIWAYKHFTAKPASTSLITAKAQIADVTKAIAATGTVNYPNPVALSFDLESNQGGKLVALNVNPGDTVKKGQVLAQLDTSDLETAVQSAQANLTLAQAKYQQTLYSEKSTILSAVSTAQQQVNNAQQALITAQQNADAGYLENQVNLARQNLRQASNSLAAAQAKAAQTGDSSAVRTAQTALTEAQTSLFNAQYQREGGAALTLAQAETAYQVAQANLTQAENQLQKYNQGQPSTDLLSAQSSLSSAQTQLATAQKNLANAQLVAPDDGVVISVPVKNYQSVTASATILTLAVGSDKMEVDTVVDQADISQVKVGQKADITLDSQPDQKMTGTVTQVPLQGTTTSDVTTYTVTVIMDETTLLLKAGMNANVNLILAQEKSVLTVPSEAIHTSNGQTSVLVPGAATQPNNVSNGTQESAKNPASDLNGNTSHLVPVVTGLDDGANVEIKSGLTEGEEVITGTKSTGSTATGSNSSNGSRMDPDMGLGGGPGGPPPGQ